MGTSKGESGRRVYLTLATHNEKVLCVWKINHQKTRSVRIGLKDGASRWTPDSPGARGGQEDKGAALWHMQCPLASLRSRKRRWGRVLRPDSGTSQSARQNLCYTYMSRARSSSATAFLEEKVSSACRTLGAKSPAISSTIPALCVKTVCKTVRLFSAGSQN